MIQLYQTQVQQVNSCVTYLVTNQTILKYMYMQLHILLLILREDGWEINYDDGEFIVVAHKYKEPKTIRLRKQDPIPIGMVEAILEQAGLIKREHG